MLDFPSVITTVIWHPRMPDHCLMGFTDGLVALTNVPEKARVKTWVVSEHGNAAIGKTPGVQDIVYSPGEEVFLVVRSDGNIFLFGIQDEAVKMKFE